MGAMCDECDSGVGGKRIRPAHVADKADVESQLEDLQRRVAILEMGYHRLTPMPPGIANPDAYMERNLPPLAPGPLHAGVDV